MGKVTSESAHRHAVIRDDAKFQGSRLDSRTLRGTGGDIHAVAIAVSVLERLRGECLAGNGMVSRLDIEAAIEGLCDGADMVQKALANGSFIIERSEA